MAFQDYLQTTGYKYPYNLLTSSHQGAWGTPETGLTEDIQSWVAPNKAYAQSGGSDILPQPKSIQVQAPTQSTTDTGSFSPMPEGWPNNIPSQPPASSGGTSTPTPSTNQPTQGITNYNQLVREFPGYAGWDPNAAMGDYKATGGVGKGGAPTSAAQQEGGLMGQINEAYAPTLDAYNQYQQAVKAGLPIHKKEVEQQSADLIAQLQNAEAAREREAQRQRTQISGQKADALAEARQLYNELKQGVMGTFGAGVSTGPAAMELLAREAAKQMGNVRTTANEALNLLGDRVLELHTYIDREKTKVVNERNTKLEELNNQVDQEIARIEGQKGLAQQAKTEAKINLLRNYQNMASQLSTAAFNASLEMDMWRKQKEYELSEGFAQMPGGILSPQTLQLGADVLSKAKEHLTGYKPGISDQQQLASAAYQVLPRGENQGVISMPDVFADEEEEV